MIITTLLLKGLEKDLTIMEDGSVYARSLDEQTFLIKLTPEDCYNLIQGITKLLKELEQC